MIEYYRWEIDWCNKEEERILKDDGQDYCRNPLRGGRMMAVWRIRAEAQDNLNKLQLVAGLPWSASSEAI